MSRVSTSHVRYLLPDSGAIGHVRRSFTAQSSDALVVYRHGRYLLPDVARGDK
jgi:hypothetical protein